jgi:hypothetical protein
LRLSLSRAQHIPYLSWHHVQRVLYLSLFWTNFILRIITHLIIKIFTCQYALGFAVHLREPPYSFPLVDNPNYNNFYIWTQRKYFCRKNNWRHYYSCWYWNYWLIYIWTCCWIDEIKDKRYTKLKRSETDTKDSTSKGRDY